MYNVLLFEDWETLYAGSANYSKVTFDTLDEAMTWAKPAIEQGTPAVILQVKD